MADSNFITLDLGEKLGILERFFNDLGTMDQRRIFMSGFRKAAKPFVNRLKALAPEGKTGNLKRSMGTKAVRGEIALLVGARTGGGNRGYAGHLVEYGTERRYHKSGKSVGRMTTKNAFFQEARDRSEKEVFDAIEEEWYMATNRFIVRTNKRLK